MLVDFKGGLRLRHSTIEMPKSMEIGAVLRFAWELDHYAAHHELTIELSPDGVFMPPFAMLFIAAKLKRMRKSNPDLHFRFRNHQQYGYLAHMGFFRMVGFDFGNEVGEARGSDNYIPITCLDRQMLYANNEDRFEAIQVLVERRSDEISYIITRDETRKSDAFLALSYSLRELIRNVFEHSQSDVLYYCAQYWPRSDKVEFALVDFGVGIRRGLAENPNFRFETDKQAIEMSLLPSVSGKTHIQRRDDPWANSGYGLYMTSRFARNGGNFVLASGDMAVHLSRRTKNNYQTSFQGTALRFNFDLKQIGNVSDKLHDFRREGAQLAKEIKGSGNRPPSALSLLLRVDFARPGRR